MQKRLAVFASVLLLCGTTTGVLAGPCSDSKVSLRGPFGEIQFTVEIADSVEERAQGLMHRTSMARANGMLFVYDAPQRVAFWMKNTLIPLDMLFLDEAGRVTHLHENAIPGDLTAIEGGDKVFAVLEINGGLLQDYGIETGAEMRHKIFPQNRAIWPC